MSSLRISTGPRPRSSPRPVRRLVIGPLHVIQLIDASEEAVIARLCELVRSGGRLAATVVDEASIDDAGTLSHPDPP